jgi:hypothetical protein
MWSNKLNGFTCPEVARYNKMRFRWRIVTSRTFRHPSVTQITDLTTFAALAVFCLSSWSSCPPTGRICVKLSTGDIYWHLLVIFWLKSDKSLLKMWQKWQKLDTKTCENWHVTEIVLVLKYKLSKRSCNINVSTRYVKRISPEIVTFTRCLQEESGAEVQKKSLTSWTYNGAP